MFNTQLKFIIQNRRSLIFSPEENVEKPEEVPHQLNDDLKLLISDLNKVSHGNADKNFEPTFDTTNCKYYECHDFNNTMSQYKRKTSALHLNISSLAKHFDVSLTPYCPSCNTTSVLMGYLKHVS